MYVTVFSFKNSSMPHWLLKRPQPDFFTPP